jgi:hypothetical protein
VVQGVALLYVAMAMIQRSNLFRAGARKQPEMAHTKESLAQVPLLIINIVNQDLQFFFSISKVVFGAFSCPCWSWTWNTLFIFFLLLVSLTCRHTQFSHQTPLLQLPVELPERN